MRKANKVRNGYAHGDWDSIKELIEEVDLKDMFIIISNLFENIESEWTSRAKNKATPKLP